MAPAAPDHRPLPPASNAAKQHSNQQYREALAFRQATLRKLAEGLFLTSRERQLALKQAGLSFPGHIFRALAFSFDDPVTVTRTHPPRDIALFWFGLANIAQELLGDTCFCEKASEEGGGLILLLNCAGELDREWTAQRLAQALAFMEDNLSVSYSVGVSGRAESLDELPQCREQALAAAQYNAVFAPRSVIFYADVANQEQRQLSYPFPEEQLLLHAVVQRNREEILLAASAFRSQLFQCRISDVRPYLLRLATSLKVQMVKDRNGSPPPYFSEESLRQAYRAEKWIELLTDFSLAHLDHLDQKRLQQKEDTLSRVSSLIRAHFQDPDLSIEELLERSGYSPGYTRKLFQEVYHCTPHNYLLTLRMEEAQRLLRETDGSVKAIATAVGFNNPSYFYAVFKKHFGVSAQDYRDQYRTGSTDG